MLQPLINSRLQIISHFLANSLCCINCFLILLCILFALLFMLIYSVTHLSNEFENDNLEKDSFDNKHCV